MPSPRLSAAPMDTTLTEWNSDALFHRIYREAGALTWHARGGKFHRVITRQRLMASAG